MRSGWFAIRLSATRIHGREKDVLTRGYGQDTVVRGEAVKLVQEEAAHGRCDHRVEILLCAQTMQSIAQISHVPR